MAHNNRPMRRSALIGPWGVGAIVPFPNDESLMIAGLDMWRYNDATPFVIKDEVVRDNLSYTITQNDPRPNNIPLGTIIYPLKYTQLPYKIYLINGGEEKEIEWLKKQDYKNLQARVWVVNGKLKELQDKLEVPIFFYSEKVHSRFKSKGTPSMINQDGEEMVYNYYKIDLWLITHQTKSS